MEILLFLWLSPQQYHNQMREIKPRKKKKKIKQHAFSTKVFFLFMSKTYQVDVQAYVGKDLHQK